MVSKAEYSNTRVIYEPVSLPGQGGEPVEIQVPYQPVDWEVDPDQNPYSVGQVTLILYYYGCIDDAIYGINTPRDRIFTLDGGRYNYIGLNSNMVSGVPGGSPPEQRIVNLNLVSLDEHEICPYRNYDQCTPSSFGLSKYLSADFILQKFNIPNQIILTRQ